jgi:hypothetical protein
VTAPIRPRGDQDSPDGWPGGFNIGMPHVISGAAPGSLLTSPPARPRPPARPNPRAPMRVAAPRPVD